ncbi:MAG: ABC transporter ATP-binding protein [Solirubrobacteraceae bacterium]
MSFGGFGGGAPMFGGGGHSSSPGGGLPFAGIPSELQDGVDKLLAREPEHPAPDAVFNYTGADERDRNLTLRQLILRYWRLGLWAVVLVSVVSVLGQVGPLLIEYAIDHGMPPQAHGSFAVVAACAGVFVLATVLSALAQRSQVRASGRLAAGVMYDLRVKVFAQLQRLGLDYYTQEKAGVVMTRMTADIENLQQLLQDGLAQLVAQALTMIVITAILFSQNVELTLITLALMVPLLTVSTIWFTRASQRAYLRVRDAIAGVLGDLSESLQGMRTVAAFNRQARNVVAHRSVVGEYQDASNQTAQINAIYGPGTQLLGYLGQGALLAIGGEMVLHHQLPIGALIAYFLYLNRFFVPIQLLVQQYTTFQQGQASVVKLRTLFRTEPNTPQAADAATLAPVTGEIRFDHVSFGYFPGQEVLHDVTLAIAPGESVAFVGETGAGKSTIAKLITRFYDPTAGRVLIDGVDLRTVTLDSLRRQLGVVPQEPFLFAGSLRENIAFARPDASDQEVWEAIDAVGLHDVVERMPDGLDTVVHERGQSLSSGERQLIALARAFHARPRVLVLDEATSNLDLMSEAKVEAALDVLLQGRTAVLIAHRLSTAMKADRIVVVDGGRIVETGSHEELVARGGRYAEMYETWSAQLELAA